MVPGEDKLGRVGEMLDQMKAAELPFEVTIAIELVFHVL
jgi:hypothetical protein